MDQRLPFDLNGTLKYLYSRDVNGVNYINANLPAPQARSPARTTGHVGSRRAVGQLRSVRDPDQQPATSRTPSCC